LPLPADLDERAARAESDHAAAHHVARRQLLRRLRLAGCQQRRERLAAIAPVVVTAVCHLGLSRTPLKLPGRRRRGKWGPPSAPHALRSVARSESTWPSFGRTRPSSVSR